MIFLQGESLRLCGWDKDTFLEEPTARPSYDLSPPDKDMHCISSCCHVQKNLDDYTLSCPSQTLSDQRLSLCMCKLENRMGWNLVRYIRQS